MRGGSRERSEREILTELFEDFTHSSPLGESISADLEDRAWGSWDRRESETLWNYSVISSIKTWVVSKGLPYTVENISVGKYSNINIRHQYIVKSSLLFISKKRVWHPNFASISHCQIFYSTWNVKNFITTFFGHYKKVRMMEKSFIILLHVSDLTLESFRCFIFIKYCWRENLERYMYALNVGKIYYFMKPHYILIRFLFC